MAIGKDGAVAGPLRTLFTAGTLGNLTDGQLLERFAAGRGDAAEAAFSALVERHGRMVLRVCRAVLDDPHDADDAFQATFLVLVRKSRSLWVRDSLGPWLHQVAHRTACRARSNAARRRRHERLSVSPTTEFQAGPDESARVLHEEIDRLPERFRGPVVLCDLEGRTHEQAARHLGWPVGTVKSRISRARERLRGRLTRRGLGPDAGMIAAVTDFDISISASLLKSTTTAAVRFAAVGSVVPGSAASLAREVLGSMSISRWFTVASATLAVGATATGVELFARQEKGESARAAVGAVRADDTPAVEVKPGNLTFTLSERGSLEASRTEDAFSQVEGRTAILMIKPEGTLVKKDELVCQLDSSLLKDTLTNQLITVRGAEFALQTARAARGASETAVAEYLEITYPLEQSALAAAVASSDAAIARAEAKLERTRRARQMLSETTAAAGKAKTATDILADLDLDDRIDAAEQTLLTEKMTRDQARGQSKRLERYTRDRIVSGLKAKLEQDRSVELAKVSTWELEKVKAAKLRRQIGNCEIKAAASGFVVYANNPSRVNGRPMIEEGATVLERQKILSIVDVRAPMVVNTKVHESIVDRVIPGQKARIEVDAFPGQTMTGTVVEVAPLPDPSTAFRTDKKVYTTKVKIENGVAGLRPGMTASAEILVAALENVLAVPIKSALRKDGKDWVGVKKPDGTFELREVTLGQMGRRNGVLIEADKLSDDALVEVRTGLKSGDVVAADPLLLLTEAERQQLKANSPSKRARPPVTPK